MWSGFDRIAVRGLRIEVQKKGLALIVEMPAVCCPAAWCAGITVGAFAQSKASILTKVSF